MTILIKKGRVIDPEQGIDADKDILLEQGIISRIENNIEHKSARVIDAKGFIVMPGIVDMHTHLREPGREDKETIETASCAALRGGVTSLLAMPNTAPCIDSAQAAGLLQKRIQKARVNIFPAGAITKNRKGHALTDFKSLKAKGVLALSDDGDSVDDEKLMLKAFALAKSLGILIICHCEDKSLSANGAVNSGIISTRMGLRGISKESEFKRIERDICLAEKENAAVHIAHVSCAESVDIIKKAKQRGVFVTAETCPHYILLSEEDVVNFDTNKKMNPPLRSKDDVSALRQAIKEGMIDALSSDHAPHTENEKDIEFERAAFGVIGLETLLSAGMTALCDSGIISYGRLVEICAVNPARILGIKKASMEKGSSADITIIDPKAEWVVDKKDIQSKSKNSAFLNMRLKGRVMYTIVNGIVSYSALT